MRKYLLVWMCAGLATTLLAADIDEFRVKREAIFEFAQKPVVTRQGDTIAIKFETKGFCDVTIAIEDEKGKIIRHLISGVLGPKAPDPLQKNSKKQTVAWDGKNDQDFYVDDKDTLTVRVSLGLKPQFEKTLYWSPYKRISQAAPLMAATEEGVIVCEGNGVDYVRMYDHEGKYLKTVYPFPSGKLAQVKGLDWRDFPQGVRYPWKQSLYQQTLLTSGDNSNWNDLGGMHGRAATGIGVLGKTLILVGLKMNRLDTDGASGGRDLLGGGTSFSMANVRVRDGASGLQATPTSVAISPDNKWVYLAGYAYRLRYNFDTMHGVARLPLDGKEDAKVFVGKIEMEKGFAGGSGSGPGEFNSASSVDCDAQGRVYVTDFMNDRVQIFSAEGKHLKDIKIFKPAIVRVHRKNGEIYVFSWLIPSRAHLGAKPNIPIQPTLTRFEAFGSLKQAAKYELPLGKSGGRYSTYTGLPHPLWFTGEIDSWSEPPTIWLGRECRNDIESGVHPGDGGQRTKWETAGIQMLREKGGKLKSIKDFGKETQKQVVRARPPMNAIQRLEVNPINGRLYVGEADSGPTGKAHNQLLEIRPDTGKIKIIDLPFNPIEYVFDLNGYLYLRNTDMIVRYDSRTLREIPFDYGEERNQLGNDGGINGKTTKVMSGLATPSKSPVCYHQGGINVSPLGKIVASCAYRFEGISGAHFALNKDALSAQGGKPYEPTIFPGRISSSTTPCIHIWDQHGKMVYEDAVPGVAQVDGVKLDREDNIYFMHTANRLLDGKPYIDRVSETLTKVRPHRTKIITKGEKLPVPLNEDAKPKRTPDVAIGGSAPGWVENAEWFYGGVGFAGFNPGHAPACACWFSRFALDYFARSIVPEPRIFSVAVLDSNGNLITRIGKYGNVDDGKPLEADPKIEIPNMKSLGGDEVSLFYACYVGTHTDRRIFISDVGNGRILSVKMGYHSQELIPLKGVPDQKTAP